ncbi:MAG: hypothetical protein JF606_12520 [Burkholderiales bacterium]|nr:hypothetical protein [Burkholderiales bacterium]
MITNEQLRDSFLTPAMKYYFDRKLAPLPSAEVDARIEELLKYLNMAAHSHGGIPFSDEIDDLWHLWIMQTKEYMRLCQKLQGSKFIHHSSNDYEEFTDKNIKARPVDLHRAVAILRAYFINYGPLEEDRLRYWPVAAQVTHKLGWTAQRLNAWLGAKVSSGKTAQHREPALETAQ